MCKAETKWFPQLARIQDEIQRDLESTSASDGTKQTPTEIVAADVPALVIPITSVNLTSLKNTQKVGLPREPLTADSIPQAGYTIVVLNLDYIKSELLPALVARYFDTVGDNNSGNYNIIVASRGEQPQILYHSTSSAVKTPIKSDIEYDLFSLRLDEIENLLPVAPQSQIQSSKMGGVKLPPGVSALSVKVTQQPNSLGSETATDALPFDNQKGRWQLFVQYQNGSMVVTIEAIRRRNLIVSFGILLMLAVSGVFLVVLLNGSRSLASQQTDFVASVTHELRTPLAVIRATSENLADGIITDAAQIKEYGALINEEERRLSTMVEQLLEFAGAQNIRSYTYESRRESIAEIIKAALNDYQAELHESDFHVVLEIEPDLPEIIADREALRRAVGNLIGNACKYGAAIIGQERRIEISAQMAKDETSKQIEIAVKDNGVGIEKKDLPHIFKLFYRGRVSTEDHIKGSGIGLSLVKQIVEAHGGTVSVVSKPKQGSTFLLHLPVMTDDASF